MKRHKKNPNLAFQGSLTIPLDADTKEEYKRLAVARGDWVKNTERILKKPRWYKIDLILFDTNGSKFYSDNNFDVRLSRDDLSVVLHTLLMDVVKEYPDVKIARKECRAVLRAIKPKDKRK